MNKWYHWLYLAIGFAAGGVLNALLAEPINNPITGFLTSAALSVLLAFVQLFCERKGGKWMKYFHSICIGVGVLLIAWIIFLLFSAFYA